MLTTRFFAERAIWKSESKISEYQGSERLEQEKQDAIASREKVAAELKTQLDKLQVTENRSLFLDHVDHIH